MATQLFIIISLCAKSARPTNCEKWAVLGFDFCRIRIAEMAVNRALAVCGGERGGFAVTVWFACLCACGWGNMPRSSRCIPRL